MTYQVTNKDLNLIKDTIITRLGINLAENNGMTRETAVDPSQQAFCKRHISDFAYSGKEIIIGRRERRVGHNNLMPAHFLEEGVMAQRAIARIALTTPYGGLAAGSGFGTGFLVSPSLLMTNNHVIPTQAFAAKTEVQFNYQDNYQGVAQVVDSFQFDTAGIFYTNPNLDFTILQVKQKRRSAGQNWGYLQLNDTFTFTDKQQPLNIIQHPQGRRKEIALQQNKLTSLYDIRVRYTTDTEPGSSGSPVFNNDWDLLAIHHAGGDKVNGQWISNEGMRIDEIVKDLRSHFGSTASGNAVLTELSI